MRSCWRYQSSTTGAPNDHHSAVCVLTLALLSSLSQCVVDVVRSQCQWHLVQEEVCLPALLIDTSLGRLLQSLLLRLLCLLSYRLRLVLLLFRLAGLYPARSRSSTLPCLQ